MRLTAGLDSGPVLLAASEPIGQDDTYGSLAPRLQRLGGELLLRILDLKASGQPPPLAEQDEHGVTYAEKIGSDDRLLDPTRAASELERVVRALQPHIGARVALADGTLLGVQRAALAEADSPADDRVDTRGLADGEAGGLGVSARDGRLLLGCTPGVLELLVVRPPGGRAMDAGSYLRGHPLPGRR
jgi:methionyl-tRNA formyltransferase